MSEEPSQQPTTGSGGAAEVLEELRRAAERSSPVLQRAVADGDGGELSAIEAVILLDDALTAVGELLTAVPALLAAARPGATVAAELEKRVADTGDAEESARETRVALEKLRSGEGDLHRRLDELAALRADVAELRRLERLVVALTALQEQRTVIDEQLGVLRRIAGDTEDGLTAGCRELLRLSDDRRALLRPETATALDQAAAAQAALTDEEERAARERAALAEAESRRARLAAERDERLVALAEHEKADRAVALALVAVPGLDETRPALDRVVSFADDIERRLADMDAALSEVLGSREARHRRDHPDIGWNDPSV